ncbi:MAG: 2-oxoacid:ferredoxin oxidoreductase gamma subunit [Anaerolineaceae bacterium]|nr:MAG: 2-oxoacid:ferredoxin oxidoreductase gamma subunit [Anaerolineaceae bacterium]
MMNTSINFLLAGVGGQGTILASDVLVNVGLAAGYQAKQAEVHGMSQRGGSVTSHVRWGKVVYSPIIGAGEVDVLLAFEQLEALRSLGTLRPGALAVVNAQVIKPLTVITGGQVYPGDEAVRQAFAKVTHQVEFVDGEQIAGSLGNLRAANIVLLGALSALLERGQAAGPGLTAEVWLKVITERVPAKHVELNRRAFQAGREALHK